MRMISWAYRNSLPSTFALNLLVHIFLYGFGGHMSVEKGLHDCVCTKGDERIFDFDQLLAPAIWIYDCYCYKQHVSNSDQAQFFRATQKHTVLLSGALTASMVTSNVERLSKSSDLVRCLRQTIMLFEIRISSLTHFIILYLSRLMAAITALPLWLGHHCRQFDPVIWVHFQSVQMIKPLLSSVLQTTNVGEVIGGGMYIWRSAW